MEGKTMVEFTEKEMEKILEYQSVMAEIFPKKYGDATIQDLIMLAVYFQLDNPRELI